VPTVIGYLVVVSDDHDPNTALDVQLHWRGKHFSADRKMTPRGPKEFAGQLGPFNYVETGGQDDFLNMSITATDTQGATRTLVARSVTLLSCTIIG
jgi:hypothetical protein